MPGRKLVALVAREYDALPTAQRQRTAILTGNYGEAGAIDHYGPGGARGSSLPKGVRGWVPPERKSQQGPGAGLPQAYSGANNFWLWAPPPAADNAVIAVNVDPALLRREFAHVRHIATFWNGLGVDDNEQGAPVYLATGLKSSWARAWPAFRAYG